VNPITNFVVPKARIPTLKIGIPLDILGTNDEFSESGFFTRISIYIYGMMGFQFLVLYGGFSLIILFLTHLAGCLPVNSKFWWKIDAFAISTGYSIHILLPIRCLQENFLKMLTVVGIEINFLLEKYEDGGESGYNPLQISGLVLSILILILSFII